MNNNTKLAQYRARSSTLLMAMMISAGLALVAPGLQAKQKSNTEEGWSEWTSMADAYVARRREPPKLDLPTSERRQENVQARLTKLLKKKSKLQVKIEKQNNIAPAFLSAGAQKSNKKNQKNTGPENLQTQLSKVEQQIVKLTKKEQKLAARAQRQGGGSTALWLHTGEEGLVSVTLTELAERMGKTERALRKKAMAGQLNLTTGAQLDSETANQAVSWHYDEATDSILFAAQAYETFFSNENAFKLNLSGKKAAPMAVVHGSAPSFGNETPFVDTLKFEEEPDLFYSTWTVAAEPDVDFWFWDYLYGGVKDEINVNLTIPDAAFTGTAQLRITLRGWTDMYEGDDHQVSAELNGTPVGASVTWDAFDQAILVADFDQSLLDASGDNTLTLRNAYTPGTSPGQWLDQVEVDYLRNPIALSDQLWMHSVSAGVQTVSGLSSDNIVVIESPDSQAILRQDVHIEPDGADSWRVTFEVDSDSDFLITERSASANAIVTADNNSKLRKRNNNAEYLIIAPRDFSATAEALAAYRSNRFGFVKIAWLDDIYNEFSAGREDPASLARFMRRVQGKWNTAPTTVVLIGKGSIDEKDRMGYADSFLPVVMTSTPWSITASDSKLLGFEDDAPFTISRLPITDDTLEGLPYLNKLAIYESSSYGSARMEAVLVADNPDDAGSFHENSDLLATRILDTLGFDLVTSLYHPDSDVRASLIESATWNTNYVSYDGHGSTSQIGDSRENFIRAEDASLLTNTLYPVFTALTCASGNDANPGTRSLASALVLNPTGGAIVSVAPTGLSLDSDAQQLGNAFVDSLYGSDETVGGALRSAKLATSTSISTFMPRMYSVVGVPEVYAR